MPKPPRQEFACPTCKARIVYDPDDPMHHTIGAMLSKAGDAKPVVVYLTCSQGHVHRYTVG
jgi:hypothetical protein